MINKNKKGSMDLAPVFVFLICFWILATILSRFFDVSAVLTDVETLKPDSKTASNQEDNVIKAFFDDVFNGLESLPVINIFVPLFRIMSFQYSDQIPAYLSIFLDAIAILSGVVIISLFKK